jgi:hypothetical protein
LSYEITTFWHSPPKSANGCKYIPVGVTIQHVNVFRPQRLPSLNRLPTELGREERLCAGCDETTVHILYRVPKKVVLLYVQDHPENLHATCINCARSTVLTGEERERTLSSLNE